MTELSKGCFTGTRKAEIDDMGECLRIWRDTWPEAFPQIPLPEDEVFFQLSSGEEIYVVQAGQGLAGSVTLWRSEPFVHFLLVDASHRGQGVGRLLLATAIAELPAPVHLKCHPNNTTALSFYQQIGCTEVERVEADAAPYVRLCLPVTMPPARDGARSASLP